MGTKRNSHERVIHTILDREVSLVCHKILTDPIPSDKRQANQLATD
jgi:hypothetical protein